MKIKFKITEALIIYAKKRDKLRIASIINSSNMRKNYCNTGINLMKLMLHMNHNYYQKLNNANNNTQQLQKIIKNIIKSKNDTNDASHDIKNNCGKLINDIKN